MKYSGIGSRKASIQMQLEIQQFAFIAGTEGWLLRSGGADGADTAFELGAKLSGGSSEIYLPWKGFNKNESVLYSPTQQAMKIAAEFHPKWTSLEMSVRKLMARNVHQILGLDCNDPVDCVVCYTDDACEDGNNTTFHTGGTGQALRIATSRRIPIYNLCRRSKESIMFLLDINQPKENVTP